MYKALHCWWESHAFIPSKVPEPFQINDTGPDSPFICIGVNQEWLHWGQWNDTGIKLVGEEKLFHKAKCWLKSGVIPLKAMQLLWILEYLEHEMTLMNLRAQSAP